MCWSWALYLTSSPHFSPPCLREQRPTNSLSLVWLCVSDELSSTVETSEAFGAAGESEWRQPALIEWRRVRELRGHNHQNVPSAFSRQCVSRAASVSERVSGVRSEGAIDWVGTQMAESHLCGSQPIKTVTSWRLILQLPAHAQLEKKLRDCTEFLWCVSQSERSRRSLLKWRSSEEKLCKACWRTVRPFKLNFYVWINILLLELEIDFNFVECWWEAGASYVGL